MLACVCDSACMNKYFKRFLLAFVGYHCECNSGTLQQEYIRGISAWNFNLEDLKSQAALVSNFCYWFDVYMVKHDHL